MLPTNFLPFTPLIETIRKYIFPNFLLNNEEKLRWYCMHILNCTPYLQHLSFYNISDYIGVHYDVFYETFGCKYSYNVKHLTKTYDGLSPIHLTEDDINKLLLTVSHDTIQLILQETIFTKNENIQTLIGLQAGMKIFPLNINELLEFAPIEFLTKYQHKFTGKAIIQHNVTEMCIKNTYNNTECKISKNLFTSYCKFYDLIDCSGENVNEITIPIEFTSNSCELFKQCLIQGELMFNNGFTVNEYKQFTSMISYLGVEFQ